MTDHQCINLSLTTGFGQLHLKFARSVCQSVQPPISRSIKTTIRPSSKSHFCSFPHDSHSLCLFIRRPLSRLYLSVGLSIKLYLHTISQVISVHIIYQSDYAFARLVLQSVNQSMHKDVRLMNLHTLANSSG